MSSKICRLLLLFALLDAGLASRVLAGAASVSPTLASVDTAARLSVRATRGTLPIGLSDRFRWPSPTDLAKSLDDAVALGVGWLRVDLSWDEIQHQSPADSDWSAFDPLVDAAAARGLRLLPILDRTPPWVRPAGCDSDTCAPADPNQFADFAAAAARRYAPRGVRTWEIWNEPNIDIFWKPSPDLARYVALLRPTVAAIRGVDPGATMISGGLSSARTAPGRIAGLDFLRAFAALGGPGLVDAIGFHPYSFPVPPAYPAAWNVWAEMERNPTSVESILASSGYPGKKIWISEYGAPTNGPGIAATSGDYRIGADPDHADEALRAVMATQSVQLARNSPVIGALFWYSHRDLGPMRATGRASSGSGALTAPPSRRTPPCSRRSPPQRLVSNALAAAGRVTAAGHGWDEAADRTAEVLLRVARQPGRARPPGTRQALPT